jgi:diphthine synthase
MGSLNLVGLGLSLGYITPIALKVLRNSDKVYLDVYTSMSCDINKESLSQLLGKEVIEAKRDLIERNFNIILKELKENTVVSIAVIGDPLISTTHFSLLDEAKKMGHEVNIYPGVSVKCYVISKSLLSSYKFGKSTTVTFPYDNIIDPGAYFIIKENKERNSHTILFLDLKEGNAMRPNEALQILLNLEQKYRLNVIKEDDIVIIGEKLGCKDERVCALKVSDILNLSFQNPPYVIIIPSPNLHYMEVEAIKWLRRRS